MEPSKTDISFIQAPITQEEAEEIKRFTKVLGVPESVFSLSIEKKTLKSRLQKKLEIEAISEEQKAEMK